MVNGTKGTTDREEDAGTRRRGDTEKRRSGNPRVSVSPCLRVLFLILLGDDFAVSLGTQGAQGQQADLLADELDRAVGEGQVSPARVLAAIDGRPLVEQVVP